MKYRIITGELNKLQVAEFERLCRVVKWAHQADLTVRKDAVDYHFEADWIYTAKIEPVSETPPQ